jgi:hypothetical protein
MTERELDELLTWRWPMVVRRAMAGDADEWAQDFVKSIARQAKRPRWRPTPRQAAVMQALAVELTGAPEDEPDLIE